MSLVKRALPPSGDTEAVAARFAAQLAVHADVHDVAADLEAGVDGLVIIDTRPYENWRQGHLPGAVPMRATSVATDAAGRVPVSAVVVTYGWGPPVTPVPVPPNSSPCSDIRSRRCWAATSTGCAAVCPCRRARAWSGAGRTR